MIKNVLVCKKPNISWIHSINIDNSINANNFNFDYLDTLNKLRSSNLKIIELRDIADKISDGPFGSQLKVEEYKEQGFPVYRVKNIIDTQILDDDIVYIDAKKQQELKRSEVLPGDVLITKAGRIGSAAVVPSKLGNGNITSHLVLVRLKKTINNYYLVAYLECKYGKVITGRESYKSTRPELTKNEIGNVIIPIPSPEIQKYIGDKVRKAEELREEAKRLKKEAEEIFFNEINIVSIDNAFKKEQHIKFNWINIDELDVNRIDAEYNRRKYTILVKLLIDNNITLIPISNLLEEPIVSGSTPKGGNYIENGIPFVRATNLCEYSIDDNLVYISKEESDKLKNSEIRSGDVVFSIAGSIGVASIIPSYIEKANINQALVRLRLNNINKYYFVFVVNSSIGRLLSLRLANGAVQLNLNREEVGNIMVPRINDNKEEIIANKIKLYIELLYQSKQLIQEAKQDVEDLIEGNFDMSKVKANN